MSALLPCPLRRPPHGRLSAVREQTSERWRRLPWRQVIGAVLKAHKGEVDNALVKAEAEKILGGGKK